MSEIVKRTVEEGIPLKGTLSDLCRPYKAGTWVILDPDMTRIISSARTPEAALRKAKIPLRRAPFAYVGSKRPVMIQVPDQNVTWVF